MKERLHFNQGRKFPARVAMCASLLMGLGLITFTIVTAAQDDATDKGRRDTDRRELIRAEQPPTPCFPNATAAKDVETVARRGDIANLPEPLETRILQLAARPHTYLPIHAFAGPISPACYFSIICWIRTAFSRTSSPAKFKASTTTLYRLLPTKPTAVSRPSDLCVWWWNLSQVCRRIPTIPERSSIYSQTSPGCLSSTMSLAGTRAG